MMHKTNLMTDSRQNQRQKYKEGDIVSSFSNEDNMHHVYKILKIDIIENPHFIAYHTMIFDPVKDKPKLEDVTHLKKWAHHVPLGEVTGEVLGNVAVIPEDLDGYYFYLKQIDLKRYLAETGADISQWAKKVSETFTQGNQAVDRKDYDLAIRLFEEVIDLYPQYFEAFDNLGLTHMDKGEFSEAISRFQDSLRINSQGLTATFSMGECYFKINDYKKAHELFKKAQSIDPTNNMVKDWLQKTELLLKKENKSGHRTIDYRYLGLSILLLALWKMLGS